MPVVSLLSTLPTLPIRYRVAMPEPQSHEFHITVEIPAMPGGENINVVFPAWAPGSYLVRDFSRHIYDLDIRDRAGKAVPHERLDKQRWRLTTVGRSVTIRYRVFAFEVSVRTSFLDDSHAFLSGTSLFFFVDGEELVGEALAPVRDQVVIATKFGFKI